jgi:signal transduction histidine kinase
LAKTTHELRTPLNGIINYPDVVKQKFTAYPVLRCTACSTLLQIEGEREAADELLPCPNCQARGTLQAENYWHYDGDPQEVLQIQQRICDSGRSLLHIVNNILQISEHEGKKTKLTLGVLSVNNLIENVLELVNPLAEMKGIRISSPELSPTMTILADWPKLGQALYNLLDNAIKFSPQSSEVVLGIAERSDDICFSIQDQGIGISEEDQNLIFESFRQVDEGSTRKYGGVGLGLAVTKNLVELHGGRVWVESELGQGSTFFVELPRCASADSMDGNIEVNR